MIISNILAVMIIAAIPWALGLPVLRWHPAMQTAEARHTYRLTTAAIALVISTISFVVILLSVLWLALIITVIWLDVLWFIRSRTGQGPRSTALRSLGSRPLKHYQLNQKEHIIASTVTRITTEVIAAAAGLLLLTACGGASESPTASTSTTATHATETRPTPTTPRTPPTPVSRATPAITTAPTVRPGPPRFPCGQFDISNMTVLARGTSMGGGPIGPYTVDQMSTFRQIVQSDCSYNLAVFDAAAITIQQNAVTDSSRESAVAGGRYAYVGTHLIGTDIQPGTWQSVGDTVTNCSWKTSDARGNVIDSDFSSVGPPLTIDIPSDATSFTNTGCAFQWIG